MLKINNVKIKINFSYILLCLLWLYGGQLFEFITISFAILLHEFFHAFVAFLFGFHTESIELFPFGGEAKIRGIEDNYVLEAIVASAGPFVSLISAFLWEKGHNAGILPSWGEFTSFSYNIALINLLPIYPLDGGRILMAVFKGIWGEEKGRKGAVWVGITFSMLYFLKCVFDIIFLKHISGIVMALFMLTASIKTIKKPRREIFREKYWKNENVKIIKVYKNEKATDVLKKFNGSNFFCVLAVDEKENFYGFFTEKQLFDGILKNNCITLKDLIKNP